MGVALGSLLLAVPALSNPPSADVVQVRVGEHPGYTRVVFELDEMANYTLRQAEADREIVVNLDAASHRRLMTSRSDLVESVNVLPQGDGAVARIRLRRSPVHITELVLSGPPRVVLDLREETRQTAARPTPPLTEEPARAAPREVEGAATSPPRLALREPDVSAGAAGTPIDAEPVTETLPLEPAGLAGSADAPADVLAEPDASVAVSVAGEPSGGEAFDDSAELPSLDEPQGEPGEEPLTAALGGEDPEGLRTAAEADAEDAQPGEGPSELLGDPRVLLALAGGLVVLVLLVSWNRSRRRDKRKGLFSTAIPHLPEEPVVEASPEPFEDQTVGRIAPAGLPGDDRSLFDASVGMEEIGAEEGKRPQVEHGGAAASTAARVGTPPALGELDRRVASLERRLEEVLDAKDRLERHVAAQTEELRVQRAAIARTQRVLRSLTRPDDAPTEPALKPSEDS